MQIKRLMQEESRQARTEALRELCATILTQELTIAEIKILQEISWLYKRHKFLFEELTDSLINEIEAPASMN